MADIKKTLREIAEKDPGAPAFLDALIEQAAEECDALGTRRREYQQTDMDYSQISTRRVQSLKLLTDMYLLKAKNRQEVDIKSPEVEILVKSILEKVKISFQSMDLPLGKMKDFFRALDEEMAGWEVEVTDQLESFRTKV